MKYVKVSASYEDIGRIKAQNREAKSALLAAMSEAAKRQIEEQLHEIAKDFGGWSLPKIDD